MPEQCLTEDDCDRQPWCRIRGMCEKAYFPETTVTPDFLKAKSSELRDPREASASASAASIDLSDLPPPTRPAVAAALQAAVGRLAAGEGLGDPRRAEEALLAELVKGQMRSILAGAAKAEAFAEGSCRQHGTPFRYVCEACDREDNPDEGIGAAFDERRG